MQEVPDIRAFVPILGDPEESRRHRGPCQLRCGATRDTYGVEDDLCEGIDGAGSPPARILLTRSRVYCCCLRVTRPAAVEPLNRNHHNVPVILALPVRGGL